MPRLTHTFYALYLSSEFSWDFYYIFFWFFSLVVQYFSTPVLPACVANLRHQARAAAAAVLLFPPLSL